ncbi:hypothetical protein K493DRAFT_253366 [Basidiobolus meristosporus CBS 931.73]|uniref:polynucleotide adenylyltransferase n=1 Tax=Basidiobolus meristosporus CBS 931.73 TaxID=1314790 RepID=A0A1Y1Z2V8_9FUNG|nr:hypothetical protein K493DRAFT_253366 [Basidiobolus meristosporus CBS 931.73]|eukprot:ORY04618.1 hypothetical protein K493DRAFT_253366 [Basidiobolus meristosporus CBS 931.73]
MTFTLPKNLDLPSYSSTKNDSDSDSSASTSSISTVSSNATGDNVNVNAPRHNLPSHGNLGYKPKKSFHYMPPKQENHKFQKYYSKGPRAAKLSEKSEEYLTTNMVSLYQSLLPTAEDGERREALVGKLQSMLEKEWPSKYIKVHMFGSSTNSLSTLTSDVDICIVTDHEELRNVYTLANCMRKNGMQSIYCVANAKVPIVRMWDPELKLACDMNVNNPIALRNTELVKAYVALDPRVRPLIMIIKHWTKRRVLNDAGVGGTLSTYTWVNIILNFLQMRTPPILPVLHRMPEKAALESCVIDGVDTTFNDDVASLKDFGSANKETLGELLFAFFKLFAYEFNYNHHVISVRNGCYLSKAEKGWHFGRHFRAFCIEEPFNPDRNLGNSADECSIEGIRQEFRRACDILLERRDLNLMCQQYNFPSKSNFEHVKYKNDHSRSKNHPGKWTWSYHHNMKAHQPPASAHDTPTATGAEVQENENTDKSRPPVPRPAPFFHGQYNMAWSPHSRNQSTSSQERSPGNQILVADTLEPSNAKNFAHNSKPFKPHSMIKPRSDLAAVGAAH